MKEEKVYEFKKYSKMVEDLCHNTLNRIIDQMNKNPEHCKKLGEYVKLCIIVEKLCNYSCSICCNCNITKHLLNECKVKCSLMVKCCSEIEKIKISKKDKDHISCGKMSKICKKLMKMCN